MRNNSTQKAYDEAFLSCSTAVYFESQNNEGEALRSWKTALDQIHYHNARRNPSSYRPASETEKALQDSLKQLELQCKERVDLLEALKRSREETKDATVPSSGTKANVPPTIPPASTATDGPSVWLGGGTVPPVDYTDLSRPPPLPYRPVLPSRKSSGNESNKANLLTQTSSRSSLSPAPHGRNDSRTPSPEKKSRMLRTLRPGREGKTSSKLPSSLRSRPPEAAKAATQAWGFKTMPTSSRPVLGSTGSSTNLQTTSSSDRPTSALGSENPTHPSNHQSYQPNAPFYFRAGERSNSAAYAVPPLDSGNDSDLPKPTIIRKEIPSPSASRNSFDSGAAKIVTGASTGLPTYRKEYPASIPDRRLAASAAARSFDLGPSKDISTDRVTMPTRTQVSPRSNRAPRTKATESRETIRAEENEKNGIRTQTPVRRKKKVKDETIRADLPSTPTSEAEDAEPSEEEFDEWNERTRYIMKNLPRGVDEQAARQILNEIVIQGDEVHWDDVAGLEVAKSALKETVVYPFLRPDLFMGLREPARGMLLFGPPGTGKTMLARAVATESKSTFFAISASSLTSKFLGESEKLVRALFSLAKMLAPSIIFVDEIDSLLSSRSGSGEHEATRRIKTEFLIQWSDLAKAAAGKEQSERDKEKGDASRVLVLAATNLPWAIDEAARRRFVRRQYIPLPEDWVRKTQVKTLLGHQKHELSEEDLDRLVGLTEGFSGSDITALAKDAAMGPLRSLGEKLLHMTMDEIPPIRFKDFEASLQTIKPSVSKEGLKVFEDWAREFGERGG